MEAADESATAACGSAPTVGAGLTPPLQARGIDDLSAMKREPRPAPDPSLSSYYVTDAFYRELVETFSDWQRDDRAIGDTSVRDCFRALLEREARLLDELRFDEWLALYAPECLYWLP